MLSTRAAVRSHYLPRKEKEVAGLGALPSWTPMDVCLLFLDLEAKQESERRASSMGKSASYCEGERGWGPQGDFALQVVCLLAGPVCLTNRARQPGSL